MRYVSSWASFAALLFVSVFLVSCQKPLDLESGLPQASDFNVTLTTDFPGVVKVRSSSGYCSGTIVSRRAVLTAAHCTLQSGYYGVYDGFGKLAETNIALNFGSGNVEDPRDISLLVFPEELYPEEPFPEERVIKIADSIRSGDVATLVGYGCNNIATRTGGGVKRSGTNPVARLGDYVEFYTPATSSNYRGIIGPDNRAGSCSGDSGGPALIQVNGEFKVAAVTHAGGVLGRTIISQYVDIANRSDNRDFISRANRARNLGIAGF